MEKRPFGSTGLMVTPLGLGAQHIGQQPIDESDVDTLLNEILDSGVNFIDTALGYGRSQEFIGRFIGHRRDEYVVSSKVGTGVPDTKNWTYDAVAKGVERCRELLKTDVIDIVHLHSCNIAMMEERGTLDALEDARAAGKIRCVGYAARADALDYAIDSDRVQAIESSVNIADQHDLDETLPRAKAKGIGTIAKHPVTNISWSSDPDAGYGKQNRARIMFAERLEQMQLDLGMPMLELALRFVCYCPQVDTAAVGTIRADHFRQNLALVEKGPLPDDVYRAVRDAFRRCDDGSWVSSV